jgi:serine/threonine protein kinase
MSMSTPSADQCEPIAGYRLIARLGGGAFGEVWKAEAPGGLFKAVKLVHGNLNEGLSPSGSAQELKALNRMKTVHHPFILGLERIDIVDGRLIIVTELADGSLWDRFQECRTKGLAGIPRDELLRYMEEAAEAIDMMNIDFGLQHLDIKPQNLFLLRSHVKVGDFGMVKDLEGLTATMTGAFTPAYGAPETFDNKLCKSSDQYSLAIVYQELLTGARPFNGTNSRQLMMQHCAMPPDLARVPEADRPALTRALAKDHQKRFPSCSEFVRALRNGYREAAPVAAAKPEQSAPAGPSIAPAGHSESPTVANTKAETPVKHPSPTPKPAQGAKDKVPPPSAKRDPDAGSKGRKPPETSEGKTVPSRAAAALKGRSAEARPRCPRCGREAIQSAAVIWCLECHYRGTVETEEPASSPSHPPVRGLGDFCTLLWNAPPWAWVLLAGIAVALVLSIVPYRLFDGSSPMRLYWAEVEFTVGLLAFFIGHMWIVMLFVKDESNVGLFSAKLWRLAAERLPDTCWQINLGSWGMTATLGGLIMGACYWWVQPTVFDKSADSDLVAAARLEEKRTAKQTPTADDPAAKPSPDGAAPPEGSTSETPPERTTVTRPNETVDKRPTEQCVIVGYRLSDDKKRVILLVGLLRDNKIVPAGEVEQDLTTERGKGLLSAFRGLERPQPPSWWTGSKTANVWLKPGEVFCEVHRTTVTEAGGLVEPVFKALLKK